eukprot:363908-Alexandrium_andersonii.AAC.1
MLWQDWAANNLKGAYGKTLLLPWDRWSEVVIDRCPPTEDGPRFLQLRAAMVCLQACLLYTSPSPRD